MPFAIKELFFSSEGQKKFKTSIYFNNLKSFNVNNSKVDLNRLTPTEENIISLDSNLNKFDKCMIEYTPMNDKASAVISHSQNKPSLYKTYSSVEKLQYNQIYNFSVSIKGQNLSLSFVSKCNPYFSNVKKIRADCGIYIDDISDETINFLIYQNSKELVEKLRNNFKETVSYNGTLPVVNFSLLNMTTSTKGSLLPSNTIPMFIKNYVRYRTDLDLIYRAYLDKNKNNGITKKIGTITIENKENMPRIKELMHRFNELFNSAEANLLLGNPSLAGDAASKNTEYPIERKVF